MSQQTVEITIPVLNEEFRLDKGVRTTIAFFEKQNLSQCSLIIADNGSTDKTEEIAQGLVAEFPGRVRYIKVPRKGVGLALRTSWTASSADIVGYMDVDLATDLKHLPEVIAEFGTQDVAVVSGSRLKKGALVENRTLVREITSRVFNTVVKLLLGVRFSDGMCGFKFLRRDHANRLIATGIDLDGWFFCTEILVKSEWLGIPVHELPVHWSDDADSRVKLARLTMAYLREIVRLSKERSAFKATYAA